MGWGYNRSMGWGYSVVICCLLDIWLLMDTTVATKLQKVVFNTHASSIVNKEYCLAEYFEPKCKSNEVITMLKADFGRMNKGRCITEDVDLGCTTNELGLFDKSCSGRRTCKLLLPTAEMKASTACRKELVRYLDASYRCQKVLDNDKLSCDISMAYPLSGTSGLISSIAVLEANCDDQAASYIINTHKEQSINFTLLDYGWKADRIIPSNQDCPQLAYGYITKLDSFDTIYICGGKDRVKHVATVKAEKVQIVIKPMNTDQPQFVLKYELIGCSKPKLPSNSWSRQDGQNLEVGCNYSGEKNTWKLMCQNGEWIGTLGNCIQPKVVVSNTKQQVSTGESSEENKQSVLSANGALILIVVGSTTLGIILIVIIVGVICIKRQSPKKKKEKEKKKKKPKKNYPPLPPKSAVLRPPNSNRNSTVTYKSVCLDNIPFDHPMMQSLTSEPGGSLKYEHLMNRSILSDGSYEHPMIRSFISTEGGSLKYENLMTRSLISDGGVSIERPTFVGNRNSIAAVRTLKDQPEYFILERPLTIVN